MVLPAYRHQGLGSRLVRAVEAGAAERGFERLYLYTRDSQAFYRRLGWRDLEEALARDRPATIMDRALIRSTRTD